MDQQLVTIDRKDALATFACEDPAATFAPILAPVRKAIDAFTADVSTAKGRKEVASFARRVVESKTLLEGIGKELADEIKKQPKLIDASRRYIKDTLDSWRDEARKPLTDWETAEEYRIAKHTANVERMQKLADPNFDYVVGTARALSADDLRKNLEAVEAVEIGPQCEEYEAAYQSAKDASIKALAGLIEARVRHDTEQEELVRLRKEADERAVKDREEELKRQAAEQAKADAERKAQAEIAQREAAAKAELEAIEAKAKADREAADRRESDLRAEKEAAERRTAETVARLKREAEEAKALEETERLRREADQEHRAAINRAALQAFIENGLVEGSAKIAITLIAKGMIPSISINY